MRWLYSLGSQRYLCIFWLISVFFWSTSWCLWLFVFFGRVTLVLAGMIFKGGSGCVVTEGGETILAGGEDGGGRGEDGGGGEEN